MLEFCDQPYRFFPARRCGWFSWLCGHLNRQIHLPRRHQIVRVEVRGQETFLRERRRGDRLVFMPKHPTHSDPQIMLEAMRQLGVATQFMAAYDVFLRSRLNAVIMSRCGAFSVDREGLDTHALKHAHAVLLEGRHALTIFPEGNVFLQNDILTPFNEGAAFLSLKAAKELSTENRVLVVPVAIKASYIADVRQSVFERIRGLAKVVDVDLSGSDDPLAWLRLVGYQALRRNQRIRGLSESSGGGSKTIIHQAVSSLLDRLEDKVGLPKLDQKSLLERVCRVRRAIHQVRTDETRSADHSAAASWADEALLAFKVASYLGDYVHRRPTLDRYAETVEKLDEDIHSRLAEPFGRRHVYVKFGASIDSSDYLSGPGKLRHAAERLTATCEQAVQRGLDEINAQNPHAGATFVAEPHHAEVLVEAP